MHHFSFVRVAQLALALVGIVVESLGVGIVVESLGVGTSVILVGYPVFEERKQRT